MNKKENFYSRHLLRILIPIPHNNWKVFIEDFHKSVLIIKLIIVCLVSVILTVLWLWMVILKLKSGNMNGGHDRPVFPD